ncbi:MAG TPA: hypothetical protein VFG53_09105 [Anaeromyxobacter sp.]|nr:hypothetical protein [Anaeromyxobacter sp.]
MAKHVQQDDTLSRAVAAYGRDYASAATENHGGRAYAVLRGDRGRVLAVYRPHADNGWPQRLFYWPPGVRRPAITAKPKKPERPWSPLNEEGEGARTEHEWVHQYAPSRDPGPEELLILAQSRRRVEAPSADPDPEVQTVLRAVMERDDDRRCSIRGLARQLGMSRYTVGKVLRQLYGEVARESWGGKRPTWTANERGRRWYARLSRERKRARYLQQRARLLAKRAPAATMGAAAA